MVVLGMILLIVGFIAKIAVIWTVGIVVVLVGAVLVIAGVAGREVADADTGTELTRGLRSFPGRGNGAVPVLTPRVGEDIGCLLVRKVNGMRVACSGPGVTPLEVPPLMQPGGKTTLLSADEGVR